MDAVEERVTVALQDLGIEFALVSHPPVHTMEDCLPAEEALGTPIHKNVFLQNRQGTEYFLLMLGADKRFVTSVVSKKLGKARLSFGGPDKLQELLCLDPGAVSPMGLLFDQKRAVQLVIDADVAAQERIACHPCVNTASLSMKKDDFFQIFLPHTGHTPTIITLD